MLEKIKTKPINNETTNSKIFDLIIVFESLHLN